MRQILQFLRLLQKEKIPFVAIGMSAARLQGVPIVTKDFDLWVLSIDAETLDKIVWKCDAMLSEGRQPPCAVNFTSDMPVDLIRWPKIRLGFFEALRVSKKLRFGSVIVPVLSLEEIIASKKAVGRPRDKAVLPILRLHLKAQSKVRSRKAHGRQPKSA